MRQMSSYAKVLLQFSRLGDQLSNSFQRSIPVALDQLAMNIRQTSETRGVNDQFAVVFDHGTQPITRFPPDPQIIEMFIQQRNHASIFSSCVLDVNMPADLSGLSHRLSEVATK